MQQQSQPETEKEIFLTRSGYTVLETLQAYQSAMMETGVQSIAKVLHFGADFICSGGINVWEKAVWEYAIFHIGLASPRIFVYLKKRMSELAILIKGLPTEQLYRNEEFQTRIAEIILVLHDCPRRAAMKWPPMSPASHDPLWLQRVKQAPDSAAVVRVWRHESDLPQMYIAACEIVKACTDGATERALFWVRWLLEEDAITRKANNGYGLTTFERGPATLSSKKRTDMGYYLLAVAAEVYKDLAARNAVRLHEEFQAILDCWRDPTIPLTGKQKREILGVVMLLLAEVPKWKVPAAPALVKDPTTMRRAVTESHRFFLEVLAYPPVAESIIKSGMKKSAAKKTSEGERKLLSMEERMMALDKLANEMYGL